MLPRGAKSRRGPQVDQILDFRQGADKIDLSTIDANSRVGGNQAFLFIGEAAFSGAAGQLRFETTPGRTNIFVDLNGDQIADMQIQLIGRYALALADLAL